MTASIVPSRPTPSSRCRAVVIAALGQQPSRALLQRGERARFGEVRSARGPAFANEPTLSNQRASKRDVATLAMLEKRDSPPSAYRSPTCTS